MRRYGRRIPTEDESLSYRDRSAPRRHLLRAAGLAVALAGAASSLTGCGQGIPTAPPASFGTTASLAVPPSLATAPLTDQHGTVRTLASLRAKVVLLVPFLSLCNDICPMTTADLVGVERALRADHAAGRVEIVEMTVDPGRDTPARLAAYARLTGATWPLVTESAAVLVGFERFLGWSVQRVAEDDPPAIDWWTHQPLTYDVQHSDGFDLIGTKGNLRFATSAAPGFHGTLPPALGNFLSSTGRAHLAHPPQPDWTPSQALDAVGWLLGRPLPSAAS